MIRSEGGRRAEGVHPFRQQEYQVILELSGVFDVTLLCQTMGIKRGSFYNRKKHLSSPCHPTRNLVNIILLFEAYHLKYPSHGYRWLNAKIPLDTGLILSDPYAHKCCKAAEVKSRARHYKYKKSGEPYKVFPNLLMSDMNIDAPPQCIVSQGRRMSVHNFKVSHSGIPFFVSSLC